MKKKEMKKGRGEGGRGVWGEREDKPNKSAGDAIIPPLVPVRQHQNLKTSGTVLGYVPLTQLTYRTR